MKTLLSLFALIGALCLSAGAQSINGNAKATFQTSYTALLGPLSASTGGNGTIASAWSTVLETQLKTPSQWDLVIVPSFEVGLATSTTVSSKNMVTDQSTATAAVKVRVLVDGVVAAPGEVTYGKRTQQLSATLEGAIAGCLSIITNASGSQIITLDPACVTPETISLMQDTASANSFTFAVPAIGTGVHTIQVQAQIAALGDNQNGSFGARAWLGKGTMTVESSRLIKNNPTPYVLGQ